MSGDIVLWELAGLDESVRFSPHCWKTRMALAHKGLACTGVPWHFHEKERLAFSGSATVPVLVDGDKVVADSWKIALYLESSYADRPSLFGGALATDLTDFVNAWADSALIPALGRLIAWDIYQALLPEDRDYYKVTREARYGVSLEHLQAGQDEQLRQVHKVLAPLHRLLERQVFIAGAAPAYADYAVFGAFMWARCVSPKVLLAEDDPIYAWRERLLDAFEGLARAAPLAAR